MQPKIYIGPIVGIIALLLAFNSFFMVDAGTVGLKLRFGKVIASYEEGIHFKIPFIETVKKFTIRIQKDIISTEAFSKDLQTLQASIAINHRVQPNTIVSVYRNLGTNYVSSIVTPITEETLKAITAKYSAENIISERMHVADELNKLIKQRMAEKEIIVSDVSIVNLDFTPQFLKAVEEKQIAEQEAKRATNLVEKVKKEAEQKVLQAQAEAEALKLQRQVVSAELIKLRQVEAQIKAIDKWDGRMPTYMSGADLPFVTIR